jgi:hypothetical protein
MARPGRGSEDGWFHIGGLQITTVLLVVLTSVVCLFEWAFEGNAGPVQSALALDPYWVVRGQVWRLLTWPIAYPFGMSLFGILALALFWYFGREIEELLRKRRMAWFLGLLTVGLGLLWVAFVQLTPISNGITTHAFLLSGISQIELMVLLVFIGEYPHRRFFFNIPGWVIAAVFIGITVLGFVGNRQCLLLLNFLVGLVYAAILAKSMGLLSELTWVPSLAIRRKQKKPKKSRGAPKGGSGTVVTGPWQPREAPPVTRDQAALDALLDKISASGMDSLTDHEREQLMVLRDRLRRRP